MKPTERQKLCTSCEGRIPLDANQCPYCAVEQSTSGQAYLHHKTIQESLTSLYPPPYATKADKESTAAEKKFQQAAAVTHASISLDQIAQSNSAEEKSCFWSLFFSVLVLICSYWVYCNSSFRITDF